MSVLAERTAVAHKHNWHIYGACRDGDPALFFHPDGEHGRARLLRERQAKAICKQCPVIDFCREQSLELAEPYGVWGGLSEKERNTILLRRSRPTEHTHTPHYRGRSRRRSLSAPTPTPTTHRKRTAQRSSTIA